MPMRPAHRVPPPPGAARRDSAFRFIAVLLRAMLPAALQIAQVVVEAVEALLPEAAVLLDPARDLAQRRGFEAARAPLRFAPAGDEPHLLEHLEMPRDRREADRE